MCLGAFNKFKTQSFDFPKVASAHGNFPKVVSKFKKLISYFLKVVCKWQQVEQVTFCMLEKLLSISGRL